MLNGAYSYYLNDSDIEGVLLEKAREIFGNPFSSYLEPKGDGFKFRENLRNGLPEFMCVDHLLHDMMKDTNCPLLQQYVSGHYPKSFFSAYNDMTRLFIKSCRFVIDLESDAMVRLAKGEFIENPLHSVFRLTNQNDFTHLMRIWMGDGMPRSTIGCRGEITMPFLGTEQFSSILFYKISGEESLKNGLKQDQFLEAEVNLCDEEQSVINMTLKYLKAVK